MMIDEELPRFSPGDAALVQLHRLGGSAGEGGAAIADGRHVRVVVASKGGRTIRAEADTAGEVWGRAVELARRDDDRNGRGARP